MRIFLTLSFLLLLSVLKANAQFSSSYQWTWINGDTTTDKYGSYGKKGTESSDNKPGSRAYASNWTDNNGNLWLFGGQGYAASTLGNLNDLWKYNVNTNKWTWVAGDSVANATSYFVALGTENPANKPSAREDASAWVDASGKNLYLFGGYAPSAGWGYLSDVWVFNTASQSWKCARATNVDALGNCIGVISGQPGSFSNGVYPACRAGSAAGAANGLAYVFGGFASVSLYYSLFEYSEADNLWAYHQADNNFDVRGAYGSNTFPGSRYNAMGFANGINADGSPAYYVFGGIGYGASGDKGALNDVWKYGGLSSQKPVWAWLNGASSTNSAGNYGQLGISSGATSPAARGSGTVCAAGSGKFILLEVLQPMGIFLTTFGNTMQPQIPGPGCMAKISVQAIIIL